MEFRVPLGAGDFRLACSEAEVRTAVAVDLNVAGGLLAGEWAPGRGPEGTKGKNIQRLISSRVIKYTKQKGRVAGRSLQNLKEM